METTLQRSQKYYYKELAEESYLHFVNGSELITESDLAEMFLPVCRFLFKGKLSWIPEDIREDLISEAYLKILVVIREKRRTISTSFFVTVIRNLMLNCLRLYLPVATQSHPFSHDTPFSPTGTAIHFADIDIMLDQLPDILREESLSAVRFVGDEYQACRYIVNRAIMGKEVILPVLTERYNVPPEKCEFFVDYVTVVMRKVLYDIKNTCYLDVDSARFLPAIAEDYEESLRQEQNNGWRQNCRH